MLKTEPKELVDRQLAFYDRLDPLVKPRCIGRVDDTTYRYEYVRGDHRIKPVDLVNHCAHYVWGSGIEWRQGSPWYNEPCDPPTMDERLAFVHYVSSKSPIDVDDILERFIVHGRLSGCVDVHGDLTLENVIRTDRGLVYIDPGRDLIRCTELDLGKIAQSVITGWKGAKLDHTFAKVFVTDTVRVFLLCAWIRLMPYYPKVTVPLEALVRHRWSDSSLAAKYFPSIPSSMRDIIQGLHHGSVEPAVER